MRVQKKSSKKPLIITLSAILIVGFGAAAFYLAPSQNDTQLKSQTRNNDGSENTTEQPSSSNQPTREEEKENLPAYEGGDVSQNNDITGVINYKSVAGSNLVLRTTINQTISSGTCSLALTNQNTSASITRTANIAANPSSASCEGFNIPLSELSSGTWNIEVTVTSGNKTGILKDSVTI